MSKAKPKTHSHILANLTKIIISGTQAILLHVPKLENSDYSIQLKT